MSTSTLPQWQLRAALVCATLVPMATMACGGDEPHGTRIVVDYAGAGFWDAPFPDEARRRADGTVDFSAFSHRGGDFVARLLTAAEATPAFGTTSTMYFRAEAALDPGSVAQEYEESMAPGARVFVVQLDGEGAGTRQPVEVRYAEDGGPWGAPHLISVLPLQGMPLAPDALYAAVVTRAVLDAEGHALDVAPALETLRAGEVPEGLSADAASEHRTALTRLAEVGVALDDVAALAVFRTEDPTAEMREAHALAMARPAPVIRDAALVEVFDGFCVYHAMTELPDYQHGELPYDEGGEWDLSAPPVAAEARVVITVPRAPSAGPLPTVVFSRSGGGGDRPLVDRGVQAEPGGEAIEPGSGPARELAAVGYAGISIDGPHSGPRNPTMGDEQLLLFNMLNPVAMRDNLRQTALELTIAVQAIEALTLAAGDCPGLEQDVAFDVRALMGHSIGSSVTPLAFAVEPRFEALIMSGAGGSWIMNVVHKELPFPVRPLAEGLLDIVGTYTLHEHDPLLAVLQWAGESADVPVYAATRSDGHVLMLQGIVDNYLLPPMANATSLSFGLDLAGDALDAAEPRLAKYAPLSDMLQFSGHHAIALPASANAAGFTRIVIQHPEDGVENGHEVVFQTEPPKAEYRAFLQTLLSDPAPTVP